MSTQLRIWCNLSESSDLRITSRKLLTGMSHFVPTCAKSIHTDEQLRIRTCDTPEPPVPPPCANRIDTLEKLNLYPLTRASLDSWRIVSPLTLRSLVRGAK